MYSTKVGKMDIGIDQPTPSSLVPSSRPAKKCGAVFGLRDVGQVV